MSPRTDGRVAPDAMAKSGRGVAGLRGAPLVAVVQAADLWNGDPPSRSQRRDRTSKGCILLQPEVRSCVRVVGDVLVQYAAKSGSGQHDDVIEALAPDGSDKSFDVGVAPRGARRRQDFLSADGIHVIERMITIAEEISRHLIPGEGVATLLQGPGGPGMLRDGAMNDSPAIMREKHQDEQEPARRRRHDEEVGRDQLVRMVDQKRTPGLRGPWAAADHVCGDGRLRHGEPQFQELTVNPRRTPQGIRGRHRANQGAYLVRDGRPTRPMAALPRPKETEPAPMPGDDGFGFDDDEHRSPVTPDS